MYHDCGKAKWRIECDTAVMSLGDSPKMPSMPLHSPISPDQEIPLFHWNHLKDCYKRANDYIGIHPLLRGEEIRKKLTKILLNYTS